MLLWQELADIVLVAWSAGSRPLAVPETLQQAVLKQSPK
jgi:hypothetical protein